MAYFYSPYSFKVIEKWVENKFSEYLNEYDLLHQSQSGFRSNHSTESAIVRMIDSWLKTVNDGKLTGCVMVDFQTGRSLKTRFREHFRKMNKPKNFDTFLYHHFKNNGHSPSKIVIQPVEKIIYDPNSSTRLKNIKRHETELKRIKFLQSPFPLGFNDNIYHEGNISKRPDFDVFFCFGM